MVQPERAGCMATLVAILAGFGAFFATLAALVLLGKVLGLDGGAGFPRFVGSVATGVGLAASLALIQRAKARRGGTGVGR